MPVPDSSSSDVKDAFARIAGAAMARGLDRELRQRARAIQGGHRHSLVCAERLNSRIDREYGKGYKLELTYAARIWLTKLLAMEYFVDLKEALHGYA